MSIKIEKCIKHSHDNNDFDEGKERTLDLDDDDENMVMGVVHVDNSRMMMMMTSNKRMKLYVSMLNEDQEYFKLGGEKPEINIRRKQYKKIQSQIIIIFYPFKHYDGCNIL
ncbi:hypothetical protein BLA29_012396 [Euroglyphus maynei]|uniref:Uncharacterized protein n=1 Tax=Euroglyphus maynei TaxID=6958 RepID=A0A1Y3BWL0_EURMA|nr:hypothetical protein BLA29_012396 [Euroglyphus maynei]